MRVNGGGHDWPGSFGNLDISSDNEIWNFVSRFDINGLIDCNTASINKINNFEFEIYPNPVIDITNLTFEMLYDILGFLITYLYFFLFHNLIFY